LGEKILGGKYGTRDTVEEMHLIKIAEKGMQLKKGKRSEEGKNALSEPLSP